MGAVFKNPDTLHGRRVNLTRGGEKVSGILLAKSLKENEEENFNFRWINKQGSTCVSDVSLEELEDIKKINEEADNEEVDNEEVDNEEVDNEEVDNEEVDNEEVDNEEVDNEEVDNEEVDNEEVDKEEVDNEEVEPEFDW